MNRETKRLLQRQGQLGPDGEPIAPEASERAASAAAAKRSDGGRGGRGGGAGRAAAAGGKPDKAPLPERTAQFLREVRGELSRVAWASRSEVINYTIVVFFAIVFLTAIVYGIDAGFLAGVNFLFKSK